MRRRGKGIAWGVLASALGACPAPSVATLDATVDAADASADAREAGLPEGSVALDAALDSAPEEACERQGGAACFQLPRVPLWSAGGAFDRSCPRTPAGSTTAPVRVTGTVEDFLRGDGVAGAEVLLATGEDLAAPAATASTDALGLFALQAPAGTPSRAWWRVRASGYVDTYTVAQRFPLSDHQERLLAVPNALRTLLPNLVGYTPRAGSGALAGDVSDCDGRGLGGAVVTLSRRSSAGGAPPDFVPGARVFYFGGSPAAPRTRAELAETDTPGAFVLLDVPPTAPGERYYLQAWGWPDLASQRRGAAGFVLLAETSTPALADAVLLPELQPWGAP